MEINIQRTVFCITYSMIINVLTIPPRSLASIAGIDHQLHRASDILYCLCRPEIIATSHHTETTIAKEYFLKYLLPTPYALPLLKLLQRVLDEYE